MIKIIDIRLLSIIKVTQGKGLWRVIQDWEKLVQPIFPLRKLSDSANDARSQREPTATRTNNLLQDASIVVSFYQHYRRSIEGSRKRMSAKNRQNFFTDP